MSGRQILVFGGTFDPVHNGHLAIAEQALQQSAAGAVWFLPAAIPALHAPPLESAEVRLQLLRTALTGRPHFEVRDDELRRAGVSYTVDTMRELHTQHGDAELWLLLGADAARSMPRWHRAAELLQSERFLVVNRRGSKALGIQELQRIGYRPGSTRILSVDSPEVSAAEIRRRLRTGAPVAGLLPDSVAAAIAAGGYYGSSPAHA